MAASQYGSHGVVPWVGELFGWGVIGGVVVGFAPWLPRWTQWTGWPALLYLCAMCAYAVPGGEHFYVRLPVALVVAAVLGLRPARAMHPLDLPSVARAPLYVTAAAAVTWLPGALMGQHGFLPDAMVWGVVAGLIATALSALGRGPWLLPLMPIVWWTPLAPPGADLPPILLVTVDSLRFDSVDHLESLQALPRLTGRNDARVPSSWALPGLASLHTGVSPEVHGVDLRPDGTLGVLPADQPTLAEVLHEVGYDSTAFVASPQLHGGWGITRGYDLWVNGFDQGLPLALGGRDRTEATSADVQVDRVLSWLRHAPGGGWMLWVHFSDLTPPWPASSALPSIDPRTAQLTEIMAATYTEEEQEALEDAYWEQVDALDTQLSRLFADLSGREQLVLVVAGTSGFELFDYGGVGTGHAHDDAVTTTPLAWSLPMGQQLLPSEQAPSLLDVAPTVLGLVGGEAVMAGRDLRQPLPRRRLVASVGAPAAPGKAAAFRGFSQVQLDAGSGEYWVDGPDDGQRDQDVAMQAALTALTRHLTHTEPGVRVPAHGLPPQRVVALTVPAADAWVQVAAPEPTHVEEDTEVAEEPPEEAAAEVPPE